MSGRSHMLAFAVLGVVFLPTGTREASERPLIGALPECVRLEEGAQAHATPSSVLDSPTTVAECLPIFEVNVDDPYVAHRFDPQRHVWELYVFEDIGGCVDRYDVSSDLTYDVVSIPVCGSIPWIAEDLDRDGEVELVTQYWDEMRIHSAPDWRERALFVWPGTNVVLQPTTFQLDDDPYWEIFATPHVLYGGGLAAVIDYDPVTDSFFIASQLIAPNGVAGRSAVADFDEDGRVEFITGNNDFSYELFEWQESTLAYIGPVGDSIDGNTFCATVCQPFPDRTLRALVGYSGTAVGYFYELLKPLGDNDFVVEYVFEGSGGSGIHPCCATDTDCDGLDELAMLFPPAAESWQWDVESSAFVRTCIWDFTEYGTITDWYAVDLDEDGRAEWGAINHLEMFRAFASPGCVECDSAGHCPLPSLICGCACFSDPVCDTVPNVLDVVTAVDVAFRGGLPVIDPIPVCPVSRTDVTCDSQTDVLDVVHLVNVIFRSGDPAVEFCDPCQ